MASLRVAVSVSGTHYVRGIEIQPGNPKIVHHCYIASDRTQTLTLQTDKYMRSDRRHGWAVLQWKFRTRQPISNLEARSPPYLEPEGMTWRLDKDTDLILIMHLLQSGKSEAIQPKVGLYFSDKPPTKFP